MIRQARKDDAEAVIPLIMLAIEELILPFTGYIQKKKAGRILKQYYETPGNRFSYDLITVDEQNGQITGMILCYFGKDSAALYTPIEEALFSKRNKEISLDLEADYDEYYIDALAVYPQYQGQGIASALMKHSEQHAVSEGVNRIGLNVDINNAAAKNVYIQKGYVADKKIMLYHKPFWHMVKQL